MMGDGPMVKLFDIISQADEFEIAPRQAANLDVAARRLFTFEDAAGVAWR